MAFSISGTVYVDRGVTPMGAGRTVKVSVNGAAASVSTTTASDGTFTLSGLTAAAATLTVYLQGNTEVGVAVFIGPAITSTNVTGVVVYQDHLALQRPTGGSSNASATQINTSDNNGDSGITSIYSAPSGTSLTIAAGKTLVCKGGAFASGAAAVSLGGGLVFQSGGSLSLGASLALTFTGSGDIDVGGATLASVIVNASGTYTLLSAFGTTTVANSNITLTAGTLDVSASNYAITCNGAWVNNGGTFNARSGTVTFLLLSSPAITSNGQSFYGLTVTKSGGLISPVDALVCTGSLTVSSGTTLRLNGQNLTVTGGTFTNIGTLQLQGGETLTGFTNDVSNGGTVTYLGSGTTTYTSLAAGSSYRHLTFSGSGRKWQPAADMTVTGNLTVIAGTLDMSNANKNLTVSGNWSNSGTFTAGTGTVIFDGNDQTVSGSTTFYNLVKTVSAAHTLTFTDGTTQTISNALTLQGASGQLLTLAGTSTGGWTLAVPAAQTLAYLDVSYGTATGNTAAAGSTSHDGGHNTNWTFSSSTVYSPLAAILAGQQGY